MAVKTENDLSANARTLWLKASSAIEQRNFGYAVSLLQAVLKETPEFLLGRQYLRRAALANTKAGKGGFFKGLSGAGLSVMKAQGLLKKDPRAALITAEEILEKDPHNLQANGLLRDAALLAGMPETALFALETMRDASPKEPKILHELARGYAQNGMPERAVEIYNRLVELHPGDLEAIRRGKDAAAQASMNQGGWNDATSYRDVLKNKEEAISLEQQSRFTKSAEMIDQGLAELSARYHENQRDLDVVRRIADLYEQKEDFAAALEWYQYAVPGYPSPTKVAI
jgi:tetratricopeptide (TPR) repeat protein